MRRDDLTCFVQVKCANTGWTCKSSAVCASARLGQTKLWLSALGHGNGCCEEENCQVQLFSLCGSRQMIACQLMVSELLYSMLRNAHR